jgi:hypothetical protein
MSREIKGVKELTDMVCKEHRLVESHWHGEGPYHCKCGAKVKAVSEDALRWIFQFHCVSEGIAYAQKEIERLLADERKDVLMEILALNSKLGCTPQEGYKDLADALRDTKHLIADIRRDEREKVREMCAACCDGEGGRDPNGPYEKGAGQIKRAIRQLDLTKELAGSSREEGQPRAEEVQAVSAAIERKSTGKLIVDKGGDAK